MKHRPVKLNPAKVRKSMKEANKEIDQRLAVEHSPGATGLQKRARAIREARCKSK